MCVCVCVYWYVFIYSIDLMFGFWTGEIQTPRAPPLLPVVSLLFRCLSFSLIAFWFGLGGFGIGLCRCQQMAVKRARRNRPPWLWCCHLFRFHSSRTPPHKSRATLVSIFIHFHPFSSIFSHLPSFHLHQFHHRGPKPSKKSESHHGST